MTIQRRTLWSRTLRRGLAYDPYEHADVLGIEVVHKPITSAHGLWLPDYNCIVIRSGMRRIHDRSALAHEIGHAVLGHDDDRPLHERRADVFAAEHMVLEPEARRAVAHCPDIHALAFELGVSVRILAAWFGIRAVRAEPTCDAWPL